MNSEEVNDPNSAAGLMTRDDLAAWCRRLHHLIRPDSRSGVGEDDQPVFDNLDERLAQADRELDVLQDRCYAVLGRDVPISPERFRDYHRLDAVRGILDTARELTRQAASLVDQASKILWVRARELGDGRGGPGGDGPPAPSGPAPAPDGSDRNPSAGGDPAPTTVADRADSPGAGDDPAQDHDSSAGDGPAPKQATPDAGPRGPAPDRVPLNVACAIARLRGPNEELEQYVRCRGTERGTYEYELDRGGEGALERERGRAEATVAAAKKVAADNGWDWAAVEEKARLQMGLNENWRTPDSQRLIDLEAQRDRRLREQNEEWKAQLDRTAEQNAADMRRRLEAEEAERRRPEEEKRAAFRAEAERQAAAQRDHVRELEAWLHANLKPGHYETLRGGTKKATSLLNQVTP